MSADVSLVKKEIISPGEAVSTTVMASKQILEGPAYRGDTLSVHLDLGSVANRLTPTLEGVGRTFSVRYFVAVYLRDTEGRKSTTSRLRSS